ncbi:uncharacterized protein BDZ99DRAFT_536643 [Mytilinidion resinicola]|uniref:Uncharacterized protein n=1 Tax=Mytilinidion resinicola TaxID=574789 RepID=A0A6A6YFA5_9PEZI|nr:uncharacterized protein BDZ99DRAFT_536643 [Mytilinidion resinicola]KAF2807289.1 hypothetical protein BDZ99DRAFT_536643 [Mytilinidion resinicola]
MPTNIDYFLQPASRERPTKSTPTRPKPGPGQDQEVPQHSSPAERPPKAPSIPNSPPVPLWPTTSQSAAHLPDSSSTAIPQQTTDPDRAADLELYEKMKADLQKTLQKQARLRDEYEDVNADIEEAASPMKRKGGFMEVRALRVAVLKGRDAGQGNGQKVERDFYPHESEEGEGSGDEGSGDEGSGDEGSGDEASELRYWIWVSEGRRMDTPQANMCAEDTDMEYWGLESRYGNASCEKDLSALKKRYGNAPGASDLGAPKKSVSSLTLPEKEKGDDADLEGLYER